MRTVTTLLFLFLLATSLSAEDWPGWRGPLGDGSSTEKNVVTEWDGATGKNVAWKSPVPGEGHSSPIVVKGRVFVLTCLPETLERMLVCFDRTSGKQLWQKTVVKSLLETKHGLNSFASSTPASDGETVYATFLETDGETVPATNVGTPRPVNTGRMVVAAYDFEGNQKWIKRPGGFISVHGFCSNPVIHGDLLIVNGDHDGDSYIVGLNRATGDTVWKINREHKTRSYVTPIIREAAGKTQMVFSGSKCVLSLDPRTGKTIWSVDGPTEQFVASMLFDGERFFLAAGFPTYHVMAIRPDGTGNVTKTHIAWHSEEAKCYVPSPVLTGKYLLVADDRGTGNCFNAETGERLWQERMGVHYSPSLVTAEGRAWFLDDEGVMKLVEPGPTLKVVAQNKLGEPCYASPAISNGQVFIRADKHLYCLSAGMSVESTRATVAPGRTANE